MRIGTWPVALAPIVLMVTIPFLLPHHREPIPTFFQEWWAIVIGLFAATTLAFEPYRSAWSLPRIALLPLAIASLILLQLALGQNAKADAALVALLYLGWVVLLMSMTRSLCQVHGESAFGRALALGLVVAGLASSAIVALQFAGSVSATGLISAPIGNRLFGNLNQPNHLALLLWLSAAAAMYLHARGNLGAIAASAVVVTLALASILSGSRAVIAYAAALMLLAFWQHRRRGDATSLLPLALVAVGTVLFGQLLIDLVAVPASTETLAKREWGKDNDGVRTGLWWLAWRMGIDEPILGIGWGQFSPHVFAHLAEYRALAEPTRLLVPAEHAHNLFAQLFAELGAAAPIAVLGFGLAWIWTAARRTGSAESHFALSLVALLLLHAQVEYTLWYAFFLGVAALAMSMVDPCRLPVGIPGRPATAAILVVSLATAVLLRSDYARLETAMRWPAADHHSVARPWTEVRAELLDLRRRSRFGSYVDLVFVGIMPFDRDRLADKLALCNAAIAFSPTHYAVFKCSGLLALDKQPLAALDRLERAMWAYPERVAEFVVQGSALGIEFPELLPLVDTARKFAVERKLM